MKIREPCCQRLGGSFLLYFHTQDSGNFPVLKTMLKYIFILIIALIAALYFAGTRNNEKPVYNTNGLSSLLASDDSLFSKAIEVIEFNFPKDHGAHNDFKNEWWYFTGNLSDGKKDFGCQFTIFRSAIDSGKADSESDWATKQTYMAHFAITDISGNRFFYSEKFARGDGRLAGANSEPLRIWLNNWQVEGDYSPGYSIPVFKIDAADSGYSIKLNLTPVKDPVFQGEKGLSQKGPEQGNASYYYSYTRLKTEGKIFLNGEEYNVVGFSWMDREWSTSALSPKQEGWDWFSLQFNNNTELMYYRLRNKDRSPDTFSHAVLIDSNGNKTKFNFDEIKLDIIKYWTSNTGVRYPAAWKISISKIDLILDVSPMMQNQELDLYVRYWEGAVNVEGIQSGKRINGKGYVELTGYGIGNNQGIITSN